MQHLRAACVGLDMNAASTWPAAYRIETPRLALRCFDPCDAPAVKAIVDRRRGELGPWLELGEPEAVEVMAARLLRFRAVFDAGERFHYAAFSGDKPELAGTISIEPIGGRGLLVGGWISPELGGGGLATEALTAVCQLAFEVRSARFVELRIRADNTASKELAERTGFLHEATLAGRVWSRDVAYDETIWTLTRERMTRSIALHAYDVLGRQFI